MDVINMHNKPNGHLLDYCKDNLNKEEELEIKIKPFNYQRMIKSKSISFEPH